MQSTQIFELKLIAQLDRNDERVTKYIAKNIDSRAKATIVAHIVRLTGLYYTSYLIWLEPNPFWHKMYWIQMSFFCKKLFS